MVDTHKGATICFHEGRQNEEMCTTYLNCMWHDMHILHITALPGAVADLQIITVCPVILRLSPVEHFSCSFRSSTAFETAVKLVHSFCGVAFLVCCKQAWFQASLGCALLQYGASNPVSVARMNRDLSVFWWLCGATGG